MFELTERANNSPRHTVYGIDSNSAGISRIHVTCSNERRTHVRPGTTRAVVNCADWCGYYAIACGIHEVACGIHESADLTSANGTGGTRPVPLQDALLAEAMLARGDPGSVFGRAQAYAAVVDVRVGHRASVTSQLPQFSPPDVRFVSMGTFCALGTFSLPSFIPPSSL